MTDKEFYEYLQKEYGNPDNLLLDKIKRGIDDYMEIKEKTFSAFVEESIVNLNEQLKSVVELAEKNERELEGSREEFNTMIKQYNDFMYNYHQNDLEKREENRANREEMSKHARVVESYLKGFNEILSNK